MVKSLENGPSVAPFLLKCYEMVDDESTVELISWSESYTDCFIIWDVSKFSSELLPKYFKHSNFSSFIRQLNIYGFRKSDTDRWEFSNDGFVKGQKNLLKNIIRRKQAQGHVQRKSSQQDTDPCTSEEDKWVALGKEVESLKTDKNALMQGLIKLRQHQQSSQSKLILLTEQLKGMEKSQQQFLSFMEMAMQNPGFLVQLLQPRENNWHAAETGKKIISRVADDCERVASDKAIVRYQHPMGEASEPLCSSTTSNSENSMELDLSDEMRDLLMNIDFTPGPLDEKFLSFENHCPLVLPDIPGGDLMLEELLLSSPLTENIESEYLDTEVSADPGIEIEPAFQAKGFDKSKCPKQELYQNNTNETTEVEKKLHNSTSMDLLTAHLGLLNSDNWLKC